MPTLTNEGGCLKRDRRLQQGIDYEIVPESLWKALALWYGKGTFAVPRTVSQAHCLLVQLPYYKLSLVMNYKLLCKSYCLQS